MRHNAKLLLVVLFLFVFNLKPWAQTPYRQYSNNGVELNFSNIEDVYFRAYLLYNLSQDDRFILTAEEDNGIFYIGSSDESLDEGFFDTFEDIYNLSYTDFQILSKLEITDLYPVWKSQVDPRFFTSMMMDITLRNTREGENETCLNADAFCTSDFYEFESATSTQTADDLEPNPIEDGCIGSSYNPSWYYLRIADSGPLTIHMEGHDPDNPSTQRDIDFCLWGPFTEEQMNTGYACSHLTSNMIIDCNYSPSYLENAYMGYPDGEHQHSSGHGTVNYHVPQSGEYYLLMITNFSRQPCVITFNKPDETEPGTTDCSILPPIVNNDGPYCVGETIHLTAIGVAGASYSWTGPNNYRSRYQNPNRSNCTMAMAGPYICTITKNGQSACDTTWVEVYPNAVASFTTSATTVCVGSPVDFTSTSTTNPAGYSIETSEWDFGDGQTASGATQSHTFSQTGTFTVTLNVATEGGYCTDETTQTITVSEGEEIQFDPVTSCTPYTWTEGNGETYSEPGVYEVVYETQTESGCPRTEYITITISDVEETETSITECDSYTWTDGNGQTYNTSGDYVFNTTNEQGCPVIKTLHLTINQSEEDETSVTECDTYTWTDGNGQTYTTSGDYTWNTQTADGCDKTVTLHLTINQSEEDETSVSECDTYTWTEENGETYS